jgi:rhodopsin domain-containing protein
VSCARQPDRGYADTFPGVLKLQLLFFYSRLTLGVFQTKTIRALFCIVGVTWAALILSVSLTCRPFHWNWQIRPLPGPRCTFRPQNFLILVVLNVVSDVAILVVPVPILWSLRVSPLRKIGVSILLCSGLFVISTAIVRAVQTLGGAPSIININRWGFRETAVGILAVTAPVLAPLFTNDFWKRGPYHRYRSKPHHRPPVLDDSGLSGSASGGQSVQHYRQQNRGEPNEDREKGIFGDAPRV